MNKKYLLEIRAIGNFPKIEIDAERFLNLKRSKKILNHALAIEEKYEIIISNYIELERQTANEIIAQMAMSSIEYRDAFRSVFSLNVKMVNLLTSARLYADQLSKHISACLPDSPKIKEEVKKIFSAEYDSSFEYRFMEALRNHVQHNGLSVHDCVHNTRWSDDCSRLEYSLYFAAQKLELSLNKKFKKTIINEMPEQVDLCSASRSYVESISNIHEQVRELIKEEAERARFFFDEAINEYKKSYKKKDIYFFFACQYENNQLDDKVSILTKWDDVRNELIKRNVTLSNLNKSHLIN